MKNCSARSWVEVSLPRLRQNYLQIQAAVGAGVAVAGVVKANAYGHGAVPVSRALVEEGAKWLAVSNAAEGVELRAAGIDARILVMGGVLPFERRTAIDANLTPVVHSLAEIREWETLEAKMPVHLKVDTGMARLGTREPAAAFRSVRVEGLLSHFATPADAAQSDSQVDLFREYMRAMEPEVVHFASSFALAERLKGSWLTMVRPGIALYGYAPFCDVKPVLTWKARVVGVKDLPGGATVGYNARFRAPRAMRTAVIAAGYADGIPRSLTNKGKVEIGGRLAPIAGAVSMDLTTLDVTDCGPVEIGDEATIIGPTMDADGMAELAGTIGYEILTGIGRRVERVYL